MPAGPLLPGVQEFDRPRSRWPRWLTWLLGSAVVAAIVIALAGFAGGVGPLRVLGTTTTPLEAVGYRPAADPRVIEVAVALPEEGLCRSDEIDAVAFERGPRIEVELAVTRPRSGSCAVTSIGGDVRWVEVQLAAPLGERTVIRTIDREPVPRVNEE